MAKLLKRPYRRSIAQAHRTVRLLTVLTMLLGVLAPLAEISPARTASAATSASSTPTPTSTPIPGPTVPILVQFRASATDGDIATAIKANGGQQVRDLKHVRIHVIDLPTAPRDRVLAAYAHHPAGEPADAAIQPGKARIPQAPRYAQ